MGDTQEASDELWILLIIVLMLVVLILTLAIRGFK